MKNFNFDESVLLGRSIDMGGRRGRIIQTVSVGGTSRYDAVYSVKFQDGTKVEMHDSQIRPFLESAEMKEEAPANSMGAGGSPHFGQDGAIQGTDAMLGATGATSGVNEQFAGVEVFDLSPDEYQQCVNGRNKYERWSKKLNMEDGTNKDIRRYSHRNPDKDIIVRDSRTGMMAYLKRK